MPITVPSYQWIKNNDELSSLCERLQNETAIALDTEFIRTNTFYPKTALLQIAIPDGAFLIDPLTIDDFDPLRAILENQNIVKIIHSCSEDLEVCKFFFNSLPTPIFDTQVAAAIANIGFSLSYSALVTNIVGVDLPKGETRSNWLARPLSVDQEHYAVLDVAHLIAVYQALSDSLNEQGRLSWLQEECAELIANARLGVKPEDYYKKIKSAWKLSQKQLVVLQALTTWREIKARELDKPRNHVVPEKVVFEVAKTLADSPAEVKQLMVGPFGRYKKQVEPMATVVKTLLENYSDVSIQKLPGPLPSNARDLAKNIKDHAEEVSNEVGLPVEVLLKKNDIEAFVRTGLKTGKYTLPKRMQGWRKAVIGDQLLLIAEK